MHVFAISLKNAISLLPLLVCFSTNVDGSIIQGRTDCCIGSCENDENGNQATTLDGPTNDQSPGIGVEFEAGIVQFSSDSPCDKKSTDSLKGHRVGAKGEGGQIEYRKGDNWQLTADTTLNADGMLLAEYILDGTQIKLDTDDAVNAASAVGTDIVRFETTSQP